MNSSYAELHCHSNYSFQEGASSVEELLFRAKELDYRALALTDHDNLCGAMHFAQVAKTLEMQTITGAEITLNDGSHLTLLAETQQGYSNLSNIISYAYISGDRKNPAFDIKHLSEMAQGLVLLTGCRQGRLPSLVAEGRHREAEKILTAVSSELESLAELPADMGLDFAKTLFRMGREDQAKRILGDLASRFDNDPDTLQKIENLLDEPVGFRQKLEARSMNRDGIKAFESGNLQEAAETFSKALEIVPDHAALNLNLVQVLMKEHDNNPTSTELLKRCQSCLDRLSGLPEQHRQHRRYIALKRKLKGLME